MTDVRLGSQAAEAAVAAAESKSALGRLTWWPSHAPSSEHMKMHVENELPSIPVAVDYQPVPAFGVPALTRHLRRCDEKMTHALRIGSSDLIDGLNVL